MASEPTCFVIGHPISHSRSPLIHGHWLQEHALRGQYLRVDVAAEELAQFVQRLRVGEFLGGNVTVPHKVAVLPLLDRVTDTAKAMGAVNTIYRENGLLCGDNTDVAGFLGHLDATVPGWEDKVATALVLGAGGASLAIVYGLLSRGITQIRVTNRNQDKAANLAARFGGKVRPVAWEDRSAHVASADLIVNTTSLGMVGQPALDIALAELRPGTIADDIVYAPLDTPFLHAARKQGAITVDGLGMLLHQAIPGFQRWFGIRPEITPALRAILVADIEAPQR